MVRESVLLRTYLINIANYHYYFIRPPVLVTEIARMINYLFNKFGVFTVQPQPQFQIRADMGGWQTNSRMGPTGQQGRPRACGAGSGGTWLAAHCALHLAASREPSASRMRGGGLRSEACGSTNMCICNY